MNDLGSLRRLMEEERKLVEALNLMKQQLSALKVEELDLKSRIRDKDIDKNKEELKKSVASVEKSKDVNDTKLNLSVDATTILNMLASGGKVGSDSDEESEMEEDPLVTFLDY